MTTWAVIASGSSATPDVIDRVRDLPCIAVNNMYQQVPWARALVANDAGWWRHNPEAKNFPGDRWCGSQIRLAEWMPRERGLANSSNSGLRALDRAVFHYKARRVLLIGVDLGGKHCHPDHPEPLGNPNEDRFALFRRQFEKYAAAHIPAGVEVLNCSPVSTLECFPKVSLDEALCVTA